MTPRFCLLIFWLNSLLFGVDVLMYISLSSMVQFTQPYVKTLKIVRVCHLGLLLGILMSLDDDDGGGGGWDTKDLFRKHHMTNWYTKTQIFLLKQQFFLAIS